MYLASFFSGGVVTWDTTNGGAFTWVVPTTVGAMYDLEMTSAGTLVAGSPTTGEILELDLAGGATSVHTAATDGLLGKPSAIHRMPDGSFLVWDTAQTGDVLFVAP